MDKFSNSSIDQSTRNGLNAAMRCFATFLIEKQLSEEICNCDLFENFADYLLKTNYSLGTMVQYLSGVFNSLKKKYPKLDIWMWDTNRDNVPKWYIKLRNKIRRTVSSKVMEAGEKLQKKSEPIGRNMLSLIAQALLLRNDVDCVEMRADFNMDFNSCGRTGEIATSSYGTAFWDDVQQTLKTDWSMEKVCGQKLLYVYADYDSYLPCVFHSIACMMICGNGNRHYLDMPKEERHWMFPNMAMHGDPVSKMNSTLRMLVAPATTSVSNDNDKSIYYVQGLTNHYTGTSFRTGSINTVMANYYCEVKHAVMRSGHDHTNICSVFEYMHALPEMVATAGKVLSHYPDPTKQVHPPKLVFVNEENNVRINNFIIDVLSINQDYLCPGGRLWPYVQTLFAVFIMHWTQFFHDFGSTNLIITTFLAKAVYYNISLDTLSDWCEQVRTDFKSSNSVLKGRAFNEDQILSFIAQMEVRYLNQEKLVVTLQQSMLTMAKSLQRIEQAISMNNSSPNKKRQRAEDDCPTEISAEALAYNITAISSSHNISSSKNNNSMVPLSKLLKHTPPYKVGTLKGLCIEQLIKDWYTYQLNLGRFTQDSKSDDVRRIKIAFKFAKKCLHDKDIECLTSDRPCVDDPSHMMWIHNFNAAAAAGKVNVMTFLKQIEDSSLTVKMYSRKTPDCKSYVTSILHRIEQLNKKGVDVHNIPYPFVPNHANIESPL